GVVSNCGASGRPFFSGPFRLWPVIEAFSRRANLQFTLEVLIYRNKSYSTAVLKSMLDFK
ncbi:hypothetical protein, partial [Enterococcus sp. BWB1-3]|uniref:hypothetical protein n=1 Tax=Enterococcus sp. BWB1-3 TaxID=2787713 RepID=UPI001F2374EC